MKYINYVGCWRIYIPYIQAKGAFMCRGISDEAAPAYFSDKKLERSEWSRWGSWEDIKAEACGKLDDLLPHSLL